MRLVALLVAAQFGVLVVNAVSTAVKGIVEQLLHEKVALTVQLAVMNHASRLELAFFEDSESYDLLKQAQQEAATRPVSIVSTSFGLVQTAITFGSMIGLLSGLNPLIAVLALLGPVPAFLADSRYGRRAFKLSQWAAPIRRRMLYLSGLVTADTAAKEVKLFCLGDYLVDRFRSLGSALYRRQRSLISRRHLAYTGWSMLSVLIGSLTYLYVAAQAVRGHLSVGDLVLYGTAVTAVQATVQGIFHSMVSIYEDNLYLDLLQRLLARPAGRVPTISAGTGPRPSSRPVPSGPGEVRFEGVSFRYPGTDTMALRDVTLTIPAGRTLAVVGPNGAGKSTLVKLLCRLYEPAEGRILLDGVDLRDIDQASLWPQYGAMFQDFVQYQATAADNIGLGSVANIDDRERIVAAARAGGADALICGLPKGYDTPLGKWFDNGSQLSGGEWQKIALSRAFMCSATVLVLDEPTSALDPGAEHDLFTRLDGLTEGRTTVFVSHRFSTVRRADSIVLLDGGRVREAGRHESLMALGGKYAQLFSLQAMTYVDLPAAGRAQPHGGGAEPLLVTKEGA
jgi:ATP-binding cassette subfamily B protein